MKYLFIIYKAKEIRINKNQCKKSHEHNKLFLFFRLLRGYDHNKIVMSSVVEQLWLCKSRNLKRVCDFYERFKTSCEVSLGKTHASKFPALLFLVYQVKTNRTF